MYRKPGVFLRFEAEAHLDSAPGDLKTFKKLSVEMLKVAGKSRLNSWSICAVLGP